MKNEKWGLDHDTVHSVAGRTTLFELGLYFPHLSLCVAYIVSLRTRIHINTPRWPRRKAGKSAQLFPISLCVFLGNCGPFSISFRLCLHFPRHARSSNLILPIATHHSRPRTRTFCSLDNSSSTRLDHCPITYACSSGNNKPHTPLPLLLHAFSLRERARVLFYLCIPELSRRLTLRYTPPSS